MIRHPVFLWLKAHPLIVALALLVLIDALLLAVYVRERPHGLIIAFLDVGQGDAVYIEAPNGNQLLYDAGPPSGAVLSQLSQLMPFYDRSIDVLVLSHPDSDHIGGFVDVLNRYKSDIIIESGASSTNGVFDIIEHEVKDKHIPRIIAQRGMEIALGDEVFADILYPDGDMSNMETNSASIVLKLRYGSTSVLLSGDLPQQQEEHVALLEGLNLHSDILKLGHHGSRTSSGEKWLSVVSPSLAIISAGKDNRYGHPHKETLERLRYFNIPSLITFDEGTIVFVGDGKTFTRE